ncbi:MAG: lytic transglycosylase domain-containing protein [Acidobacteriota bacterium]|nr:lytic transglycosylase domain-containing protein [Acidobacteriota bacterium]
MRCRSFNPFLLTAITSLCFALSSSPGLAQTSSISLVYNSNGNAIYINTGEAPRASVAVALKSGGRAAEGAETAHAHLRIQKLVQKSASRNNVDPKLVDAVIGVESGWDPRAVSSKGALGLMQLIPATAARFGVEDPFDPRENIRGGVTYLRYLLGLFKGSVPLSLAAYNAGEHRVERAGGIPAIPETVNYVRRVTSLYRTSRPQLPAKSGSNPIYRYVDSYGVVHFSND